MNDRRSMEKELKAREDEKVKGYWRAEEERHREMQRRKREEIDNVRRVNQNSSLDLIEKSKIKDEFVPYNDYN